MHTQNRIPCNNETISITQNFPRASSKLNFHNQLQLQLMSDQLLLSKIFIINVIKEK